MIRHFLTGLALTSFVALALAASPVRADDWSKSYPISGRANLTVSTGDGDVTIAGSDKSTIDAHISTIGYKLGPNDVQIIESQTGNQVSIEVKFPHMNWNWGGHRALKVDLKVPRDLDMNINTSDGNVTAQTVSGNLQFSSGDGNVTATQVRGTVKMHTGDGNMDGTGFDGSLEASTGDGNVKIEGRFDTLNLKSGDGNIEAQANAGSKLANNWDLRSGDGHITLRVPGDLNANLDAHTGDGSISLDLPVSVSGNLSHTSIRGKLNAGGATLAVSTGDGSIHIEKL
jgi:Putative adhesin